MTILRKEVIGNQTLTLGDVDEAARQPDPLIPETRAKPTQERPA
jgi:hypothetical protein